MVQKLTRALLTFALVVGALIVAPNSATAAGTCSGTRIDTITHRSSVTGNVVAHTGIYKLSNTRYCVRSLKYGVLNGTQTWMNLKVYETLGRTTVDLLDEDYGHFYEYAGPLTVTVSSSDRCVAFGLGMVNRGGSYIVDSDDVYGPFC